MVRGRPKSKGSSRGSRRVLKIKIRKISIVGGRLMGIEYCDYLRLRVINESRRIRMLKCVNIYAAPNRLILSKDFSITIKPKEEIEVDLPFTNSLARCILRDGKVIIRIIDDRNVHSQKTYMPTEKEKEFIKSCMM